MQERDGFTNEEIRICWATPASSYLKRGDGAGSPGKRSMNLPPWEDLTDTILKIIIKSWSNT